MADLDSYGRSVWVAPDVQFVVDYHKRFCCSADGKGCWGVATVEAILDKENFTLEELLDEEELMNLLFSFLEPNRSHSTLLAGYFNKTL
ncbi:hypothetical protein HN51_069500 [Arachis hypogaea]